MLETTPLGLKGAWTLGSLSGGQSVLNFSVKVVAARARESCTAKAKANYQWKVNWKCYMLQQHTQQEACPVLGDL